MYNVLLCQVLTAFCSGSYTLLVLTMLVSSIIIIINFLVLFVTLCFLLIIIIELCIHSWEFSCPCVLIILIVFYSKFMFFFSLTIACWYNN